MKLRILLLIHGIVTIAAGLVLIFFPAAIPKTVGIALSSHENILCYFLAAAEIAIGWLSVAARNLQHRPSQKIIITSFIIFHLLTAILELVAWQQGLSKAILPNVVLRAVIVVLLYTWGLREKKGSQT